MSYQKRLLIIGGTGLLGLSWAQYSKNKYNVYLGVNARSVNLSGVREIKLAGSNVTSLDAIFSQINPDIVVNAAGLTNVEQCEANAELAKKINTELSGNIAKVCARYCVPFVHISTDHLFDGDELLYSETAKVNPKNVYASTKADAEQLVLENWHKTIIARTNFYTWGPSYRQSFSDWIINSLRNERKIQLFEDVHYTPIYASVLIETIYKLFENGQSGTFNIVCDKPITKLEFGYKIAQAFDLNSDLILPSKLGESKTLVKRPLNMSLSNAKIRDVLGKALGTVDDHISILKSDEATAATKEIVTL